MQTSIVDAIVNLVKNPVTSLVREYHSRNRANNAGDALEEYVKDLFAGTFDMREDERLERLESVFSYLGNNSNPPDAMLRGGDAIEVKKIETVDASLALNSSYPKHTIRADSPMISEACRNAEDWREKDMLYVVGSVHNNMLKHLVMVYGLDYCASESCYQRLKTHIAEGVNAIEGVEFAETKELGRVNRVDPLGITYLRVRGMWGIENPWTVFKYVYQRDMRMKLNFMALINERKWQTLPDAGRLLELSKRNPRLKVSDVKIKDPDNPAHLNAAKLIQFDVPDV
jgi:hypothetical protein